MHNKQTDAENDNAARMGRGEGAVRLTPWGQKSVRAAKGDGGAELRGCETASWSPVCAVPWSGEGTDAVPACGDGVEYEEDGAILMAVTGDEGAVRKKQSGVRQAKTRNSLITERSHDRDLWSLQKKNPMQKYGVRQQSDQHS